MDIINIKDDTLEENGFRKPSSKSKYFLIGVVGLVVFVSLFFIPNRTQFTMAADLNPLNDNNNIVCPYNHKNNKCSWFDPLISSQSKYRYICLKGAKKTGTTWLEYIIATLMRLISEQDKNYEFIQKEDRSYHLKNLKTKKVILSVGIQDYQTSDNRTIHCGSSKHKFLTKSSAGNIVIIRDPRDAAISRAFYLNATFDGDFNNDETIKNLRSDVYQTARYVQDVFDKINSNTVKDILVIKYESLLHDSEFGISLIAEYLKLKELVNEEIIEQTIAANNLSALKQQEMNGKIYGGINDDKAKAQNKGVKVREGKSRVFDKYLSSSTITDLNEIIDDFYDTKSIYSE
eukprot:TRINITY_DN8391_c0_g1_i1.p1 TRINITY_DN8391_c0_g1~~TRINITY_DN8391_c0_g1_i1.p1  ORF type:complete len:346 (-),score=46.95 TRINITY_DN8391_c0_g1_i1:160-1197(-)